jgi:hypothetical protein
MSEDVVNQLHQRLLGLLYRKEMANAASSVMGSDSNQTRQIQAPAFIGSSNLVAHVGRE